MKLSDLEITIPVTQRVCVYGPPKSGKTQLASLLTEHFNLKWFDLENGMSPLLKLPAAWKERVDIVSIPDDKDLPIAIETMLKVITGAKGTICAKHGKWNCALCKNDVTQQPWLTTVELNALGPRDIVVIDSGTQIASSALNWVMRNEPEDSKPERDEWGALKFVMEKFLGKLQRAKFNIIMITHEDEVEMVDGKDKVVPVSGSRNTSRNTAKYFDHVVYCNMKNQKHVFGSATTYAASVLTGSRLDVKIETLAAPSLLPFFEHLLQFPLVVTPILPPVVDPIAAKAIEHITEDIAASKAVIDAKVAPLPTPVSGNATASAALARLRLAQMKEK